MTDRQGVEIDYCPKCRGVWLDRGELEKLVDASVAHTAGTARHGVQPTDEYDDDDDRDRRDESHQYGKYKKRESWLSRIFDFD